MLIVQIIFEFVIFFCAFFNCYGAPTTKSPKTFSQSDAEAYLNKFGYLTVLPQPRSSQDLKTYNEQKTKMKEKAIRQFQVLAGLPETGKLDEKTTTKMLSPRCGLSDLDSLKREGVSKWPKNKLQWTIKSYTSQMSEGDARRGLSEALNTWSKVSNLDFVEVNSDSKEADIQIRFARMEHDDPYPFDGKGIVLAHAFYPKDGRLHFDDDERWAYDDQEKLDQGYTDLLIVAAHELGHSLGLVHSKDKAALMYPYYHKPQDPNSLLAEDDITRIQNIYGARKGSRVLGKPTTQTTTTTTTTKAPVKPKPKPGPGPTPVDRGAGGVPDKRCPTNIDAATTAMNSESYFFYGNTVWVVDERGTALGPVYIDELFPKGPTRVTAVVTNQNSQLTLLFQERRLYAYEWNARSNKFELHQDFPKDLTNEITFTPNSAFRHTDGNVMLVNGNDFAIFDEYWNKQTFQNKMSNYFSNIPTSSTEIFNYQQDIIVQTGSKYKVFDVVSKELKNDITLKQMLKC